MGQIALQADGQSAMALAGANPRKPLYFSVSRTGRYLIDYHGDHVYEIRATYHDVRLEWGATVRAVNSSAIIARGEFHELGDAVDYLQAEARTRGAGGAA